MKKETLTACVTRSSKIGLLIFLSAFSLPSLAVNLSAVRVNPDSVVEGGEVTVFVTLKRSNANNNTVRCVRYSFGNSNSNVDVEWNQVTTNKAVEYSALSGISVAGLSVGSSSINVTIFTNTGCSAGSSGPQSDDFEISAPENAAPTLSLDTSATPAFTEDAGVSVGDMVVRFTTADEDGDTVSVTLNDETNYLLGDGRVNLTQAGLNLVNAGTDLPTFILTPNDGTENGTAATVNPTVTAANDAPTLSVADAAPAFTEGAGVSAGATVTRFTTSDEEGDAVTVSLNDTTNYQLSAGTNQDGSRNVTLTQAGIALIDAGTDLPTFTLTPNDNTEDGSAITVNPTVSSADNAAPTLSLDTSASPAFTEDAGVSVGDMVVRFTTADEDGDTVSVTLNDETNYLLGDGRVNLTQAGLNLVNAGTDLPTFTLTPNDGTENGTAAAVNPTVTAANDAPTLSVDDATPSFLTNSGVSVGATVVTYSTSDEEGETVVVTMSATNKYELDSDGATVTLTQQGLDLVNAGTDLPAFTLTPSVDSDSGPAVSVDPSVRSASTFTEVGALFDVSQRPLDVGASPPNIVLLFDRSKSMAADILTNEIDGYYNNSQYSGIYNGIQSEGGVADTEADSPGDGLWRLRSKDYNRIYYNPEVEYQPWATCDGSNSAPANCLSPATPDADLRYYYVWQDVNSAICSSNVAGEVDGTPSPLADPPDACAEGKLVAIRSEAGSVGSVSALTNLVDFSATGFADGNARYPRFPGRDDCSNAAYCTLAEEIANFDRYYTWSSTRVRVLKSAFGQVIDTVDASFRVGYANSNSNSGNQELEALSAAGHKTGLLNAMYGHPTTGNSQFSRAFSRAGNYLECVGNGSARLFNTSNCPQLAAPAGTCQQNFIVLVTDTDMEGSGSTNNRAPSTGDATDTDNSSNFDGGNLGGSIPSRFASGNGRITSSLADTAMYYYERDLNSSLADDVIPQSRDLAFAKPSTLAVGDTMHQHVKTVVLSFGVNTGLVNPPSAYSGTPYDWDQGASRAEFLARDLQHAAINGRGGYIDARDPVDLSDELNTTFSEFDAGLGAGSAVSFNSQDFSSDVRVYRSFYDLKASSGDLIAYEFNSDFSVGGALWSLAEQLDDQVESDVREILTYQPSATEGNAVGLAFLFNDISSGMISALGASAEDKLDYLRGDRANERPDGPFRTRSALAGQLGDIVNSTPVFVGPPNRQYRGGAAFPTGAASYAAFQDAQKTRALALYVAANDGMLHSINPATGQEQFAFIPNGVIQVASNNSILDRLDPAYAHQFILDGAPIVDDVFIHFKGSGGGQNLSKSWGTLLLGAFGGGGKGLFALDITDPDISESDAAKTVLWEFTETDDVYPTDADGAALLDGSGDRFEDAAGEIIKDMGLSIDEPVIALSNVVSSNSDRSLEWVALFGNGLNSRAGIAKLFTLFVGRGVDGVWCHPDSVFNDNSNAADGLRDGCTRSQYDFVKVDTGIGGIDIDGDGAINPNGLGSVRAIDTDKNGTVDYVYAGDARGNLFRFDLCLASLAAWEVGDSLTEYSGGVNECKQGTEVYRSWTATKLFEATYTPSGGSAKAQPALNRPIVVGNALGGNIVVFGTGRYLVSGDETDEDIQSIYGIWDRLTSDVVARSELAEQSFTNRCESTVCERTLSDNVWAYNASPDEGDDARLGWYIDLDTPPESNPRASAELPGERATRNLQIRGGVAFVNSVLPISSSACSATLGGFELAFCPETGGSGCFSNGVFDVNNDGEIDAGDFLSVGADSYAVAGLTIRGGIPSDASFASNARVTQLSDRSLRVTRTKAAIAENTGRLSWRHLSAD